MKAITIHFLFLLQALFIACQNLANNESKLQGKERIINLNMQHVSNLQQLSGHCNSTLTFIFVTASLSSIKLSLEVSFTSICF